jgi:hypothetical protein
MDILKDEQKSMAEHRYRNIINEASERKKYDNFINDSLVTRGDRTYDLSTEKGRRDYG